MLLSCQTLDVLHAFYIFFGTNLLTQCQVTVPIFPMFLTPFRGDFETESKRKKIPEKIFSGTKEDRGAWEPRQGIPRGPTSPHPAARGRPRPTGLWAPWAPSALGVAPIYSLKIPKKIRRSSKSLFRHRKLLSPQDPIWGTFRCPAGGGFGHGGLLHQHHDLSDDV